MSHATQSGHYEHEHGHTAELETECEKRMLRLYVLPPKSPQMNGGVERCNGAWRYAFYAAHDLPATVEQPNPLIDSFQHLYNHHRPHGTLGGKTPEECRRQTWAKDASVSQMT